jgi:glutaredoxin
MRTVTLYTRPGCHLCDDARAALQRLSARHEFEIHEVNIETDDALHAAYLERIPVIWPRRRARSRTIPGRADAHRAAHSDG